MCGIVAVRAENPEDLEIAKHLLWESQIRGKHSTGVSYINKSGLHTIKDVLPASVFVSKYWDKIETEIRDFGSVSLVAHTRYSTSGAPTALNAQPIANEKLALIMNGVIAQSSPDRWYEEFGVQCQTENDTEIAYIKLTQGIHPLSLADNIRRSMAICTLRDSGRIQFFRNGRRPQQYCRVQGSGPLTVVASTKEIVRRALKHSSQFVLLDAIQSSIPGFIYELLATGTVVKHQVGTTEDWQL